MALYCLVFLASIAVSCLLTSRVRDIAKRYNLAHGSTSSHHIHSRPITRLGGLAIFLTFLVMLSCYLGLSRLTSRAGLIDVRLLRLLLPASWLFAIGLIDDLHGLGARAKLLGQIVGGFCLYASGLHLLNESFGHFTPWLSGTISLFATVFLVVAICNAINLIDGLDGLAAGVALFSMVSILVFALVGHLTAIAVITLILGGAVVGFLVFNFSPASIFLGDSGSLFVGLMLSGLVIALCRSQGRALNSVMLPLFCFALPLTDTVVSVLRRLLARRPIFEADRGHIHHKLLDLGLTQRQAVYTLYGVSAVCTVFSLVLLARSGSLLVPATAVLLLLFLSLVVSKLGYREFERVGWTRSADWAQAEVRGRSAGLRETPVEGSAYVEQLPLHQTFGSIQRTIIRRPPSPELRSWLTKRTPNETLEDKQADLR